MEVTIHLKIEIMEMCYSNTFLYEQLKSQLNSFGHGSLFNLNSANINLILMLFISFDSSWNALQHLYCIRDDWVKNKVANLRKSA